MVLPRNQEVRPQQIQVGRSPRSSVPRRRQHMKRHSRTLTLFFAFLLSCAEANADRLVLASASYGKNIVAICDANGKILWSFQTGGPKTGHAGHHDIQLLENGNI